MPFLHWWLGGWRNDCSHQCYSVRLHRHAGTANWNLICRSKCHCGHSPSTWNERANMPTEFIDFSCWGTFAFRLETSCTKNCIRVFTNECWCSICILSAPHYHPGLFIFIALNFRNFPVGFLSDGYRELDFIGILQQYCFMICTLSLPSELKSGINCIIFC